jgi:hypothetical protein
MEICAKSTERRQTKAVEPIGMPATLIPRQQVGGDHLLDPIRNVQAALRPLINVFALKNHSAKPGQITDRSRTDPYDPLKDRSLCMEVCS